MFGLAKRKPEELPKVVEPRSGLELNPLWDRATTETFDHVGSGLKQTGENEWGAEPMEEA